jgi:hypothetical protein
MTLHNVRGSLAVQALGYKAEGRGFETRWGLLSAAPGRGVYSASNRNEYRKHLKKMFLGSKVRQVREADNLVVIYEPTV